ncbi:MAG: hypothetical protein AAGA03_18395, partial [Planctomycetota bacterium]
LGKPGDPNDLPIIEIARDQIELAVAGNTVAVKNAAKSIPLWQRYNDYGIGLLLKGKAELKQAAEAFRVVESMGRFDGALNLARVQFAEGDLDGATASLQRADTMDPPPPSWTHGWLSGIVNRQQGNLQVAAESLRGVLESKVPSRGLDYSKDYMVRNQLGLALIDLAQQADLTGDQTTFAAKLAEAETEFRQVLQVDRENVTAHANLAEIYAFQGDADQEATHRRLHAKYKPDDNAAELARPAARRRYPAANHAAEALTIYDLQRDLQADGKAESISDRAGEIQPLAKASPPND